jgi:hypothetical protein
MKTNKKIRKRPFSWPMVRSWLPHHLRRALTEGLDARHGGPFDRGAADSYYHRPGKPHYYVGDTGSSELVEEKDMTAKEIEAYHTGFDWNEEIGAKKDWR